MDLQTNKKATNDYPNNALRARVAIMLFEIGIAFVLVPFVFVYFLNSGFIGGALANFFFILAMVLVLIGIIIVPLDKLLREDLPVSRQTGAMYVYGAKFLLGLFFVLSLATMFQDFTNTSSILIGKTQPQIIVGKVASVHASPFTILFSRELEVLQSDGAILKFEYRYPKGIELDKEYIIMVAPLTNLILSLESIK